MLAPCSGRQAEDMPPGPIEVTAGCVPTLSELSADAHILESAQTIFSPSILRRSGSSADGAPSWPTPSSRKGSDNPFLRADSDHIGVEPNVQTLPHQSATAQIAGSQHEADMFSRTAGGGTLLNRLRNSFRSRKGSALPAWKRAQHAASPIQQPVDDPIDMDNVPAIERELAPAALTLQRPLAAPAGRAEASNASQPRSPPASHADVMIESRVQQPTLSVWGAGELTAVGQTFATVKATRLDVDKVQHQCRGTCLLRKRISWTAR